MPNPKGNCDRSVPSNNTVNEMADRCLKMKPEYCHAGNSTKSKAPTKSAELKMTLRSSLSQPTAGILSGNSSKSPGIALDSSNLASHDNTRDAVNGVFSDFRTQIQDLCIKFDQVYSVITQVLDNVSDLEEKHDDLSYNVQTNTDGLLDLENKFEELERRQRLNKALLTYDNLDLNNSIWRGQVNAILLKILNVDQFYLDGIIVSKFGNNGKTVLLEFVSPEIKRLLFAGKKNAREAGDLNNIYLNEFLSAKNLELLKKARDLKKQKKIKAAFSSEGRVYIKLTDDSERKLVNSMADLENL